jgi:ubiquinone/menaquinone biosynthesis C-methylase UbiE
VESDRQVERAVWRANIDLHAKEGPFYDAVHFDIFNFVEQHRLRRTLALASSMVASRSRLALDFGCGTGNVTSKLLSLGWEVMAVDTSKTMLTILNHKLRSACNSGQLVVRHLGTKRINLASGSVGLITCYSVLHHLYDYMSTLGEFSRVLDEGGVLYVDHEHSDGFWNSQDRFLYQMDRRLSSLVNDLYLKRVRRIRPPWLDYGMSDYRTKQEKRISWPEVKKFLQANGFSVQEWNYLVHRCVFPNPLHLACKGAVKDTRAVIAVKSHPNDPTVESSQSRQAYEAYHSL